MTLQTTADYFAHQASTSHDMLKSSFKVLKRLFNQSVTGKMPFCPCTAPKVLKHNTTKAQG